MRRIHLICNAHIDAVWLWNWEEAAGEALSTFRTAADFCEEYNGFVFNHNEALLYEWVEEYEPALFERIRALVGQGKWHIMGGWYLQPDCNLPAGESFIRQIERGRAYFSEKFGVQPKTAINFDSFGHSRGLVQILEKCGYDSYIVCRAGRARELTGGSDLKWIGFDGSEIIVHISDENYNTRRGMAACALAEWRARHEDEREAMFLWGIGNHGGGPSREDMQALKRYAQQHPETALVHSTPECYFARVKGIKKLMTYADDLAPVLEGCYTAQARIKRQYRLTENLMYMCEKMLSSASLCGLMDYPAKELDAALTALLKAQFHDALPGSSVPSAEEATLRQLNYSEEILLALRARAFFVFAAAEEKIEEGSSAILVYNPHPYPVKAMVECELVLPNQNWNGEFTDVAVYEGARLLPSQCEQEDSNFAMDWRKKAVFIAELKPQINRFDCRFTLLDKKPAQQIAEKNGFIPFKTNLLDIKINAETGLMDSYIVDGAEYFLSGAFTPLVMNDVYNTWDVGFKGFDDIAGSFTLVDADTCGELCGLPRPVRPARVIEDGSARTVVEALFHYNRSWICQRYKLPKVGTEIEIETRVLWNEKDKLLKLCMPTALSGGKFIGQTAFGSRELSADGSETVSQKWCMLSDASKNKAVQIINEGIYGSNCKDGEIRLSLLRSAGYAASDFLGNKAYSSDRYGDRFDLGERVFRFWINGGNMDSMRRTAERDALSHNEAPFALAYCPPCTGKRMPPAIALTGDTGVVISSVRKTQRNIYIIRLFNSMDARAEATLNIDALNLSEHVCMEKFEVKTFLVDTQMNTIAECGMLGDSSLC